MPQLAINFGTALSGIAITLIGLGRATTHCASQFPGAVFLANCTRLNSRDDIKAMRSWLNV
jgi:hypothetical protein